MPATTIRCYEKAGFAIDGKAYEMKTPIGVGYFYRMIKLQLSVSFSIYISRSIDQEDAYLDLT